MHYLILQGYKEFKWAMRFQISLDASAKSILNTDTSSMDPKGRVYLVRLMKR